MEPFSFDYQNPHSSPSHSSRARREYLEVSLSPSSGSESERCLSSLPCLHIPYYFFLWVLPSCLSFPPFTCCLKLASSETSPGPSPHFLFLHKNSFPRSDIAWGPTGLSDLESLGKGLTGLGTSTSPQGTIKWKQQVLRPTFHGGPAPQPLVLAY